MKEPTVCTVQNEVIGSNYTVKQTRRTENTATNTLATVNILVEAAPLAWVTLAVGVTVESPLKPGAGTSVGRCTVDGERRIFQEPSYVLISALCSTGMIRVGSLEWQSAPHPSIGANQISIQTNRDTSLVPNQTQHHLISHLTLFSKLNPLTRKDLSPLRNWEVSRGSGRSAYIENRSPPNSSLLNLFIRKNILLFRLA